MSGFASAFLTAFQDGATIGVSMLTSLLNGAVSVVYDKTANTNAGALTDFGYLIVLISAITAVVGCCWLVLGMVKHRR